MTSIANSNNDLFAQYLFAGEKEEKMAALQADLVSPVITAVGCRPKDDTAVWVAGSSLPRTEQSWVLVNQANKLLQSIMVGAPTIRILTTLSSSSTMLQMASYIKSDRAYIVLSGLDRSLRVHRLPEGYYSILRE